jgi:hypothetical protein
LDPPIGEKNGANGLNVRDQFIARSASDGRMFSGMHITETIKDPSYIIGFIGFRFKHLQVLPTSALIRFVLARLSM